MLALAALVLFGALFLKEVGTAIYNLFFHPLKAYPGPKVWIAFPILRYVAQCRGTFDQHMVELHRKHGQVVRFTHDSLSFATAQGWRDIYGYGHGQNQWPKLSFSPPGSPENIFASSDENHARFRKALSYAFSDTALRLQETLIKGYIDKLVAKLREEAKNGRDVDMTMWYNLTTFDIISDLAFGESSLCLENQQVPSYLDVFFKFAQAIPYLQLARVYPAVWKMISVVLGSRARAARENLAEVGRATVAKRKADRTKDGRGDFMEALLKHNDTKQPFSDDELAGNAQILFFAGSETTATMLAGVTYWMLHVPDTMKKAVEEVRAAFPKEEDITFSGASAKLPYMLACLEEGLRIYPPVPTIHARRTTETAKISGHIIPAGTYVGVHQMGSNRLEANFHKADEFHPERWLPEATDAASPFHNDNRDARQPFSVGPRNCIGKNLAFSEMRQILARILWNFDLELVDKEQDWMNQKMVVFWEKGPLVCKVSERADKA